MGDERQPALPGRFAVRMGATLVLTMVAVGVTQYELADRALTSRVLAHDLDGHRADAEVLQSLHRLDAVDPLSDVQALLGHMAARPGLDSVVLLGPDGDVLARGSRHSAGMTLTGGHGSGAGAPAGPGAEPVMPAMPAPVPVPVPVSDLLVGNRVLAGGRAVADHLPDTARVVHAVPVDLGGARSVLLVGRSDAPLVEQVDSVRRVLLLTLILGTGLALPLFFLVGGRGLAAQHRRAVDASTRDGLTGLGNHRYFHERMAAEVADSASDARPRCLALVDLDGFKQVNDGFGHRRGDEVLATVARTLLAAVPRGAYRVGGDEFALLLPGTPGQAAEVAERIRLAVAGLGLGVTASIGVAPVVPGSTAQPLWDAADAALYAAKHSGRNRVVVDGSAAELICA